MCRKCQEDSAQRSRHANRTTFRAGPDRRRHRFTAAERRLGYHRAVREPAPGSTTGENAEALAWVYRKVRKSCRRKAS